MKKIITLFTLVIVLASTNSALALTPYERAVALMNTINTSQAVTPYQLTSGTTVCLDLTTDLSREDKGTKPEQVTKLQNFLYPKYLTEPATGYFGVLTEAAVKKFQAEYANEIPTPTGYVGPLTRNIIKSLTCTGTQASTTGTKANETTTSRNNNTASAYDPNGAWWLNPVTTVPGTNPTTPGNTDPIKTTPTGNTTPTSTTLPPNCEQYAGVIPGESRKVSVEYRGWALQKYNYPISTEAQAQLSTMRGDLGNIESFRMIGGGFGNWSRESFNSGVAYVWPIKTTEYNDKIVIAISGAENPQTVDGEVIMSISKCPGDFTSPQLLSQRANAGERLPICVSQKHVFGNFGLIVSSGNPNGYTCDLEQNSQYYLNISAGFSKSSPLDQNGMPTASPGLGIGGRGNGTSWIFPGVQSADMIMYAQDYRGQGYKARPANGAPGLIKGKDEYYRENDRVAGIVIAAMQQRVAACRAAIANVAQPNRGALGGGGECTGLANPLPPYEWR